MRFKKIIILLVLGVMFITSCKNTLDVQAPYKDITVVYGLLDQNDAIHYIRINKAFEGNTDAYTMAKQYDSIYYPVNAISAVLQDSNPNTGAIVNSFVLDTTTTVPLGPGIFSNPKQLLYYTKATLNPDDYYNLVITNSKIGKKLRGSTYLLSDLTLTGAITAKSIELGSAPYSSAVAWQSNANAQIYQMTLLFYYDKKTGNNTPVLQTPLQLVYQQQTASTSTGGLPMEYELSCQQLFTLILSSPAITAQAGVSYHADSLGIVFTSGTYDLNTYIQLSQPPTGINQDVPSFSDVANGVGLFTARHVQTFYRPLDAATLDSIQGPPGDQENRFADLGFTASN